ncbi:uncharacterized protein [Drosophila tropicalis]|uniref:uncharacterized protein n=1 Tax=Drosophila tropicalis TaxID=46794 RepID=UPI0035ABA50C
MRPPLPLPIQTAGLPPNDVSGVFQTQIPLNHHQVHVHTATTPAAGETTTSTQHNINNNNNNSKIPPLELLVEHKLSYSSTIGTTAVSNDLKQTLNGSKSLNFHEDHKQHHHPLGRGATQAGIFDEAAENFIINYPSESQQQQLPLSETVPLLTHIEATVVDKQRSILLNKNSASLIFTKKELGQQQQQQRQHHSSLYGRKQQTKHLPSTRGQQHRRSLQLNYNNNLVHSSSVGQGGAGGKLVPHKQQQRQHHGLGLNSPTAQAAALGAGGVGGSGGGGSSSGRKQLSYSWYAPVYSALEEELEQESRDSSPIHNLANTKQQHRSVSQKAAVASASTGLNVAASSLHHQDETVALLDIQSQQQQRQKIINGGDAGGNGGAGATTATIAGNQDLESSLGLSGGGQLPRRRRFENFLKSLVGLKASQGSGGGASNGAAGNSSITRMPSDRERAAERPASPEIRITRTPSEQDMVVLRDPSGRQQQQQLANHGISGSSSSLNVVQQKLWHMMRRENSSSSLQNQEKSQSIVQYKGLRKCETVLALTRQSQSLAPGGTNSLIVGSGIFSPSGIEQIRPLNRLRNSVNSITGGAGGTCSRCSSLLSLAASGSRYSLVNGFVPRPESAQSFNQPRVSINNESEPSHINVNAQIRLSGSSAGGNNLLGSPSPSPPSNITTATLHSSSNNNLTTEESSTPNAGGGASELGPFGTHHAYPLTVSSLLSMATANQAAQACCVRDGITLKRREMLASADVTPSVGTPATPTPQVVENFQIFTCKLCLIDVENAAESTTLLQCGCQFCTECMRAYVDFEITEGAYEISCPDAKCPTQGAISLPEIADLTTTNLLKKHHRYRLNREIELDKTRTWCPRAGCETICLVATTDNGNITQMDDESPSTSQSYTPSQGDNVLLSLAVHCPSCKDEFCALCKKAYHPNISCEEFGRRLIADGQDDIGIPFDNELIKCCPMCAVPIEKDEGCAQMMCKRCKHVFCWYCLASLDDDFLLRHYDKGPCKNKLGHSRASVVWHRAQVIGIFAGFGILLLVASPLLLLAAPCIICCKCRGCSGSKIDEVDAELEEEVTALQG